MAQRLALFAQRQDRHRGVTTTAGLRLAADASQFKTARLPETPQRLGIAKADREIIQPLCLLALLSNEIAGNALLTQCG
ncbi:hypothetical protein D3C86_1724350 [compost metagenome]